MLIIGKAFTDRRNRNNQAELMSQLRNQPAVSQPDDWMAKFTKSNKVEQNIESPRISPQNFERGFKRKSSGQKPVTIPVEERLRDAAALVLDTHDRTSVVKEADQLLDSINITGINSPLRENSKLELRDYSPNMTKRNDPQNLLNDRKVNNEFAKQVPLPDDDELDF
jgi:hypothetical protein